MTRILRKGETLPVGDRQTPVRLMADVEVEDLWRSDDHFAGWLWNINPANLELHAADLATVERDEEVDGVMVHRVYNRTYGNNAIPELTLVSSPPVEVPTEESEPETVESLMKLRKDELVSLAHERGIETVPDTMTKAEIAELIINGERVN